jgi:antitoxin component YwqK of YwqJK toxin-antitoxin module
MSFQLLEAQNDTIFAPNRKSFSIKIVNEDSSISTYLYKRKYNHREQKNRDLLVQSERVKGDTAFIEKYNYKGKVAQKHILVKGYYPEEEKLVFMKKGWDSTFVYQSNKQIISRLQYYPHGIYLEPTVYYSYRNGQLELAKLNTGAAEIKVKYHKDGSVKKFVFDFFHVIGLESYLNKEGKHKNIISHGYLGLHKFEEIAFNEEGKVQNEEALNYDFPKLLVDYQKGFQLFTHPKEGQDILRATSGNKLMNLDWKDNLPNGSLNWYYPNGNIRVHMSLKEGRNEGYSYALTEKGDTIFNALYTNGIPVFTRKFRGNTITHKVFDKYGEFVKDYKLAK